VDTIGIPSNTHTQKVKEKKTELTFGLIFQAQQEEMDGPTDISRPTSAHISTLNQFPTDLIPHTPNKLVKLRTIHRASE